MKKWIAALLVLCMLMPSALGETLIAPHAFTLELPDGWKCDYSNNSLYSDEPNRYYFLGSANNRDKIMEWSIWKDSADKKFSLYGAKQTKLLEHQSAVQYSLEKNGLTVQYKGLFDENEKKIPFMIFYVQSLKQGDYFYAHTVSKDWWIEVYYYNYFSDAQIKEAEIDGLYDILRNFQPIL